MCATTDQTEGQVLPRHSKTIVPRCSKGSASGRIDCTDQSDTARSCPEWLCTSVGRSAMLQDTSDQEGPRRIPLLHRAAPQTQRLQEPTRKILAGDVIYRTHQICGYVSVTRFPASASWTTSTHRCRTLNVIAAVPGGEPRADCDSQSRRGKDMTSPLGLRATITSIS